MKILFSHNNFPGQFRRLVSYIEPMKDVEAMAVTLETNKNKFPLPRAVFRPHREPTDKIHPAVVTTERAVLMGQAAYKTLMGVKEKLGSPDIILSHSGWGASLFFKDVFPDAKLLNYYEWYYHCHGGDGEFLSRRRYSANDELRIRMKNTPILHDLAAQDWGQSPTQFQHSRFPEMFRKNISVLHDGVDVDFFCPQKGISLKVGDVTLTEHDEVVTYVARGMEEYRGFPQFMHAISKLQKRRPNMHVVILGSDRVAYGNQLKDGKGLKEPMLKKYDFDMSRLHFMGVQPLPFFRDLMRISSAHIYLTAPFVLSWSMLEAMSTGALVIGSDTEPVRELITDGEQGILVDFWDTDELVDVTERALENPLEYEQLRIQARNRIVGRYSTKDLLPKYWRLIKDVAAGRTPKLRP
ncbi:glycosyltransferase [Kordiimonas marina]|uniref:glycosyltransferase n=1 Tax=Kordiimonas marina TaxID=2872312 RepID=UPI001FF50B47|nr:glycosyltransferase [Kordiimonas marina]MCJ9430769.1 glycosyltransferase [Kordiimonas marina]